MTSLRQVPAPPDTSLHPADFLIQLGETHKAHASLDPATRLYAIVDTRGLPDLRAALARLEAVAFEALWDGTELAAHKDISPLLIEVDVTAASTANAVHQLIARLRRLSIEAFAVTWVWSPHALDELAIHFRGFCEYTLPDRQAFYLHFYDNRILERLPQVWTEAEQERFAGPAFELWFRSRAGTDCTWRREDLQPLGIHAELAMTEAQHLALLALGYADKLALQLRHLLGDELQHLSQEVLYDAVSVQLERAARYRIQREDDMLKYVAKGLLISPRFDEHSSVRPRLMAASYGDIPFAEALSQVDDACRENSNEAEAP